MGTRAVLARQEGDGWSGRYLHWDGYPTSVGPALFDLYTYMQGDVERMLHFLLEAHEGWSSISRADWSQEPGYIDFQNTISILDDEEGWKAQSQIPQCYCHGDRSEEGWWITHDGDNSGAEWAYVISENGFAVLAAVRGGEKAVGMFGFNEGAEWQPVSFVNWDDDPDWERVECGQDFELCVHYAWAHFEEANGTTLTTRVWLGIEELDPIRDAVGFTRTEDGRYFRRTGNGWLGTPKRGDYPSRKTSTQQCLWWETVIDPNGLEYRMPVFSYDSAGRSHWLDGLEPVLPEIGVKQ